jgi:hypothetical protein
VNTPAKETMSCTKGDGPKISAATTSAGATINVRHAQALDQLPDEAAGARRVLAAANAPLSVGGWDVDAGVFRLR